MDILPILSTLKRHKTAAGLIVLQIALTCAIVCNALFLISERIDRIQAPTGMAESELVVLNVSGMTRSDDNEPQTRVDLERLRALPGVRAVTLANQVAYGGSSSNSGVRKEPGDRGPGSLGASHYNAREGYIDTLGLRLVEGRDFRPEEYINGAALDNDANPRVPAIILNQALARQLFPGESALGKSVYVFGEQPLPVVGVLAQLVPPHPGAQEFDSARAMLLPVRPSYRGGVYLLRCDPGQREAVLKAAGEALMQASQGVKRLVREQKTLEDMRSDYYRQDRTMVWLLGGVCVGLLVVTAFGIVGLASFWVQQRTRMIGTRRALGATQGQILRYFQTENLLLSSAGIALGMAGAYGINQLLMQHYELPRLPLRYLPVGAVVLWGLGQLAVLAPARRAAALPPVAALRGP
jgi:putative ABC transport system permease protein